MMGRDRCHLRLHSDNTVYISHKLRCDVSRHVFKVTRPARALGACLRVALLLYALPLQAGSIETAEVRYRTLPVDRVVEGEVEAVHRSTVSAQTAGEVVELPFDVNDFVPKGSLIVRIDDTRQKAELDKAAANEAEARARLTEAESAYQRNLRLIKENAVSKSQMDKSEADLKAARAQLELSTAALKSARKQWEYTRVEAPYDGVVVERFVELGEQVQVGTPLGAGLSLEKLRVAAQVPASLAQAVRDSGSARVSTPAGTWVNSDSLTFFPYADEKSHSFTVRVKLPEGQYGLYPGMLVKVAFTVGEQAQLVVPTRAIVKRSEVTGVYVLEDDQSIRFRQVRPGHAVADNMTIVLAGLDEGEKIALDPVAAVIKLKQGTGAAGE
jgi:RND family efflux transporter MFP subunit